MKMLTRENRDFILVVGSQLSVASQFRVDSRWVKILGHRYARPQLRVLLFVWKCREIHGTRENRAKSHPS